MKRLSLLLSFIFCLTACEKDSISEEVLLYGTWKQVAEATHDFPNGEADLDSIVYNPIADNEYRMTFLSNGTVELYSNQTELDTIFPFEFSNDTFLYEFIDRTLTTGEDMEVGIISLTNYGFEIILEGEGTYHKIQKFEQVMD